MLKKTISFCLLTIIISLAGCATSPPKNVDNLCSVFQQYPKWYWATQDVQKQWGVPISVQMAIIHQESHFGSSAKPPHQELLGFIPWFRPTSAYGYSQATDESWQTYQRSTGHTSADRDSFSDAVDFIGWYAEQAHKRAGISKGDPYKLYLAYHEGIGGYMKGTYRHKQWLIDVAHKVDRRAWSYHAQLSRCQKSLPVHHWWDF
ncbi:MAG: hypothetical protein KAT71_06445 [Gammaproteobacteria bacterium]|nr:hypothetical protein [Gammaproteobacteria bacterium]